MQGAQSTVGIAEVRPSYDVVVVGAGPAGCGAAACFAARGASVLLVESNPKAATRFAGEWIHPEGARVLKSHGLMDGLQNRVDARGFAVCANDGLGPIELPYPDDARGFACEHETLVTHLRERVKSLGSVDYIEGVRAQPLGADLVMLAGRNREPSRVDTDQVVVATGRAAHKADVSHVGAADQVSISLMAGLMVTNAELPVDGYGHVILGGPGPALAYRVDERRIRLCIDVPLAVRRREHTPEWIWNSLAEALPTGLRRGVRTALSSASLSWAANAFRPRRYATKSGIALVGDAAGIFHPLTAMGITMSLLDAEALAAAPSLAAYAEGRAAETYVPELLSNAIYQAFVREDSGSEAIRESIFHSWRSSPAHRDRTMRLLGATSTRRTDFVRAFSRVAMSAGANAFLNDRGALPELAGWLRWPWASLHPRRDAMRSRSVSWAAPETWSRPDFFRSPDHSREKRHAS